MSPFFRFLLSHLRATKGVYSHRRDLRLESMEGRDAPAGSLHVQAFADANGNGAWDGGEAGVAGVCVAYSHMDYSAPDGVTTGSGGTASAELSSGSYAYTASAPNGDPLGTGVFTVGEGTSQTLWYALSGSGSGSNSGSGTMSGSGSSTMSGSGSGSAGSSTSGTMSGSGAGSSGGSGSSTMTSSGSGSSGSGSGGDSGSGTESASSSSSGTTSTSMATIGDFVWDDLTLQRSESLEFAFSFSV